MEKFCKHAKKKSAETGTNTTQAQLWSLLCVHFSLISISIHHFMTCMYQGRNHCVKLFQGNLSCIQEMTHFPAQSFYVERHAFVTCLHNLLLSNLQLVKQVGRRLIVWVTADKGYPPSELIHTHRLHMPLQAFASYFL